MQTSRQLETEDEEEAVIAPGDSLPTPSPRALRKPRDPGSPVYSVPPASYPKPWLGAQPAAIVTPGVNVTLSCRAPQPAWRFALFKSGRIIPVLYRGVSMELAEFFLEEVTPAQGGSYHCCYRRLGWGLGVWSHPSDTLELLVTDELPRPSLVALPGPVVAPGANVSLRCAGRLGGMSFALYRVGEAAPVQYRRSAQPWADFPLRGARAPGTYSCYYHTPSSPYVLSQRSEPLVISADGSGSLDYTQGNLVRLGLAGLVLLSLGTLVFLDWRARSRIPCSVRP
ncbi:osteoclast-associated immunoglobulin-like receptor isoform X1 [Panthera uncia]|uniref:osteoclast-associated immunoglobulin-like receptor isoform X1 n=1 Tax=Panthera uncia TaxID=29064 RepID=UPI0020FF9800|nr:osteoclast-associated immunoglobulin-like receptor isoform X1 [Panthera uncia]XP_049477442.1 osteoclast-associated immunoglobulin-like receptor isoform X1 [Panthera uncia]